MILADAGPLVALIDRGEPYHGACVAALREERLPMVTTLPAFTEAMYLLGRRGWRAQAALWRLEESRRLEIHQVDHRLLARSRDLMLQYHDLPMDFADATLVAVGEAIRLLRILALDAHFHAYRTRDGEGFEVVPAL